MSVLVIGKFQGDTAKFRQALTDRADEFAKITDGARSAGAIHHRFGIGDGFVLIVDEWGSVEQFQQFFSNPDLQAFIGSVGAAPAPAGDHRLRGRHLIGPVLGPSPDQARGGVVVGRDAELAVLDALITQA